MVPLKKIAGIMLLTCLAQPAMASTITETYSFFKSNKNNKSAIAGLAFNQQLGTLTYASATFDGTYTPRHFAGSEPDQARSVNLQFTLGFPLSSTSLPEFDRGIYNLALRANEYLTGTSQSFDTTGDVAAGIDRLASARPFLKQELAFFDTSSNRRNARASIYDYLSSFSGTMRVTYTYIPVPEPASAGIFAAGILMLSAMRRRSISDQESERSAYRLT